MNCEYELGHANDEIGTKIILLINISLYKYISSFVLCNFLTELPGRSIQINIIRKFSLGEDMILHADDADHSLLHDFHVY